MPPTPSRPARLRPRPWPCRPALPSPRPISPPSSTSYPLRRVAPQMASSRPLGVLERRAVNSHAGEARATEVGPARIDAPHRRIPEVGTPRDGTPQVGAVEVAPAEVAPERPPLQVASRERFVGLQRAGVEQLGLGRRDACVLAVEDRLLALGLHPLYINLGIGFFGLHGPVHRPPLPDAVRRPLVGPIFEPAQDLLVDAWIDCKPVDCPLGRRLVRKPVHAASFGEEPAAAGVDEASRSVPDVPCHAAALDRAAVHGQVGRAVRPAGERRVRATVEVDVQLVPQDHVTSCSVGALRRPVARDLRDHAVEHR
eukprot:scaffold21819_cov65-Phaeocystis_antarctica.AAC.5